MASIAVEPFIYGLVEEGLAMDSADIGRLACTRRAIVPFVRELSISFWLCNCLLIDLYSSLYLKVLSETNCTILDKCFNSLF